MNTNYDSTQRRGVGVWRLTLENCGVLKEATDASTLEPGH